MKNLFVATLLLLAITRSADARVEVASLSTVLGDIAHQVGGDRVEVIDIVEPGIDPHIYEPTPGDIKKISKARLVLASGLGFEGYLDKLRSSVGKGPDFFVAGDLIRPIYVEEHDHDHDHGHGHVHDEHGRIPDPHWWHSIDNVRTVTRGLARELSKIDPEGRATYEANAKAFDARLQALAKWVRLEIAKLPKAKRTLITSHDALGYFARDNGFEILAVEGINPSDQPSSQKVRALVAEIKARGTKSLFAENIENPKVLGQITRETGATLGGTLYADGLGTGDAATYDGMMRHNVTTIVTALQ